MNTNQTISEFLQSCNVESIDQLTDEQIVYLYTEIKPERGQYNVVDVYSERSGDDAHAFANDVRKCIDSEHVIVVNPLMNEGIITNDDNNKYRFAYAVM